MYSKASNTSLKTVYGPGEEVPDDAYGDGCGRDPLVIGGSINAKNQRRASAQIDRSANFTRPAVHQSTPRRDSSTSSSRDVSDKYDHHSTE